MIYYSGKFHREMHIQFEDIEILIVNLNLYGRYFSFGWMSLEGMRLIL